MKPEERLAGLKREKAPPHLWLKIEATINQRRRRRRKLRLGALALSLCSLLLFFGLRKYQSRMRLNIETAQFVVDHISFEPPELPEIATPYDLLFQEESNLWTYFIFQEQQGGEG